MPVRAVGRISAQRVTRHHQHHQFCACDWRHLSRITASTITTPFATYCQNDDSPRIVKPILMLGLPDQFIDHGDPVQLLKSVGLDGAGIAASIEQRFGGAQPRLAIVIS